MFQIDASSVRSKHSIESGAGRQTDLALRHSDTERVRNRNSFAGLNRSISFAKTFDPDGFITSGVPHVEYVKRDKTFLSVLPMSHVLSPFTPNPTMLIDPFEFF